MVTNAWAGSAPGNTPVPGRAKSAEPLRHVARIARDQIPGLTGESPQGLRSQIHPPCSQSFRVGALVASADLWTGPCYA